MTRRLLSTLLFAAGLAGCTAPGDPALIRFGGFNTQPLVTAQTPGASFLNGGVNQPFETPNSLPPGAALPDPARL